MLVRGRDFRVSYSRDSRSLSTIGCWFAAVGHVDLIRSIHLDGCQDSFYRGLTPEESANVKDYNFDHPNAMDQEAIVKCLCDLKNRIPVEVPIYDFKTHR